MEYALTNVIKLVIISVYMYMQLLTAVMKEFNEVAKGSVSVEDLSRAKSVHEQCNRLYTT